MFNDDIRIKVSDMLKQSRYKADKSQSYMATALGVSRKTIQNWEDGTTAPDVVQLYEWFNALCMPPHPYILKILYPDVDSNKFNDDAEMDKAIQVLARDLPMHEKRKLLFILEGRHGSSPTSVIDMMVANLQTPLRDRLNICQCIISNYEIAEDLDILTDKSAVRPSVEHLKSALASGIKAVQKRMNSYLN